MMNKKLKHLIHQLNAKSYPPDMRKEFYVYKLEAYNALKEIFLDASSPSKQRVNIVSILVSLSFYAVPQKRKELLELYISSLDEKEDDVLQAICQGIVGIFNTDKSIGNNHEDIDCDSIRKIFRSNLHRMHNVDRRNYIESWIVSTKPTHLAIPRK